MSEITLEAIQAKQNELSTLIQKFIDQVNANSREIEIEGCTIVLDPGEHYAGAVLNEDGSHKHHLVLMAARPTGKLSWQSAMDWAASVNGVLPDRQEQALLFANCKPHMQPVWHWSSHTHEDDASYAWHCRFNHGYQHYDFKSAEGAAVAVRRFNP